MNRITAIIAAGTLFLAPAISLAASIGLSPANVSTRVGQTFTVTVVADPSGSPLYTASANLSFNANVLEVTNFSFAPTWVPLTQTGYDETDNAGGTLIKTGGYPGGFTAATTLGTVTFEAKAAGTATIAATGNSILLDGGNGNEVTGAQGSVTVTVGNAAPAATQSSTQVHNSTKAGSGTGSSVASTSTTASSTSGAAQTTATATAATGSAQTAAAAAAFGGVPSWVWWLILAIIVIGGGYLLWRRYGKRRI